MPGETPVLVVLPFAASGDELDALLARGLGEDISGELTRFRALAVISPVSAATVADLPDRDVGERLGASHVLRGTLRRFGDRLRLTASLIECAAATQLWCEQIDAAESDFFSIGDEVVGRISASLAARLEDTALTSARRRPTESLAAYGLTLRGMALLRQGTREADDEARALFERALALDPAYARAHAGLSLSWFNEWSCQYWSFMRENGRRAYEAAHRALRLDDRDAMLHLVIGRIRLYRREFEQAAWYFDRALALCPNDADLLIELAVADAYLGRTEAAVEHARRAMRLNPYHPNHYHAYAAQAHLVARDLEGALALAAKVDALPFVDAPAHYAVALAQLGRMDEAREHLRAYHREFRRFITPGREPAPGEPLGWFLQVNPYRRPEDLDFILEGFRLLGEPGPGETAGPASRTGPGAAVPMAAVPMAALPGAAVPGAAAPVAAVLVRRPDGWLADYAGRRVTLPELKGLNDIRRLLAEPGEPVHCLDLAERTADLFAGDAALDERARSELKARIRDLQEEIEAAEAMNDRGRVDRARAEMEALLGTLSKALGLGGRGRRLGDAAEKARTAVTWRIRHAVKRIEAAHPELGRHLANSLRTGTFCAYRPERAVAWQLGAGENAPSRAAARAG